MRPQTFDSLNPCLVDIYTIKPGGLDPSTGDELPPSKNYCVQNARADLQPRGGTERIAASGTTYDASHVLFLDMTEQYIPQGAKVDIKTLSGDPQSSYEVTFPGRYGDHWQLELKAVE